MSEFEGEGEEGGSDRYQIVSAHNGLCLTSCAELVVYAGPISPSTAAATATATVVLFNRSVALRL